MSQKNETIVYFATCVLYNSVNADCIGRRTGQVERCQALYQSFQNQVEIEMGNRERERVTISDCMVVVIKNCHIHGTMHNGSMNEK